MFSKPPRLAEALLRRVLPDEDAEAIAGDFEEQFHDIARRAGQWRAAWWHWRQVVSVTAAWARRGAEDRLSIERRGSVMSALRQDLIYATRTLGRKPGFTATVVLMLALGIGANVAIFALINAALLQPLPLVNADRLMLVHTLVPERDAPAVVRPGVWSYPKYEVFRQNQQVFEASAIYRPSTWNLTGTGSAERVYGELVERTYFDVLGVQPLAGRSFSADETRTFGSPPLAVLGHAFWMRRFGGDRAVVGRTVGLNGIAHTVLGVLPPGFRGLSGEADVWVPLMTLTAADLGEPWSHSLSIVARRAPRASPEAARAAMDGVAAAIAERYPSPFDSTPWGATAVSLHDDRVDPLIRRAMLIMVAAVAAVLLIVCINLANLMLARTLGRQREVAIRLAVGASRLRIVRQLMTESLLLSGLGALCGLFVAYLLVSAGAAMLPDLEVVLTGTRSTRGLTRIALGQLSLDASVLLYAFGIAALTALLFGLGPALRVARRDLTTAIRVGSSGAVSGDSRAFGLRSLLAVSEIALALILLAAGGLMVKSVARIHAAELGFDPSSLLSIRLAMHPPKYDGPRATQLFEQLLERLAARPEIESVAYGNSTPVSGGGNTTLAKFPGRPPAPPGSEPAVGVFWASPAYFDTLKIRVIRGRVFTDRDRAGQPKVIVINQSAARHLWRNEDPIGQRIAVGQGGFHDGAEVVGVVADVRYGPVEAPMKPDVYLPLLQSARPTGVIYIRSGAPASVLVPLVRRELDALDPDIPLVDVKMLDERFGDSTWRTRMSAWLLTAFAALGLLLAILGVYGVISQGVEQRVREIGIRMALGAARGDIFRLVIGRVLLLGVAGVALGVVLAIPATRALRALLYDVRPGDPAVIGVLALVLLAAATLAGYLPARRATRVDPLTTLRVE